MKGIQYVTDDSGKRTAALVDLREWGEEWEDFIDGIESEREPREPSVSWDVLKREMQDEARGSVRT
jgi:hypothetical protein